MFEQRPRPEFVSPQTVVDMIVIGISGVGGQHFVDSEKMFKGMIKPDGRGCAAKQMVMRGEALPDRAWILFSFTPVGPQHAKIGQWHTLACQHTEQVMIRNHQKLCRVRKALVLGKPAWLAMAVRADDGKVPDAFIESPRHVTKARIDRKQTVWIS